MDGITKPRTAIERRRSAYDEGNFYTKDVFLKYGAGRKFLLPPAGGYTMLI